MTYIQITVEGAQATATVTGPVTAGAVGIPVNFTFDKSWEGLTKTAVFRAGDLTVDKLDMDASATLPAAVTAKVGCTLQIGVYGASADGTVVIPTVWAEAGVILPGADPSGDETTDPALPVYQQLLQRLEALEKQPSAECPVVITRLTYSDESCPECQSDIIGYMADMDIRDIRKAVEAGKLVYGLMVNEPANELGMGSKACWMLPYSYDGDHYLGGLMLHSCQGLQIWVEA